MGKIKLCFLSFNCVCTYTSVVSANKYNCMHDLDSETYILMDTLVSFTPLVLEEWRGKQLHNISVWLTFFCP